MDVVSRMLGTCSDTNMYLICRMLGTCSATNMYVVSVGHGNIFRVYHQISLLLLNRHNRLRRHWCLCEEDLLHCKDRLELVTLSMNRTALLLQMHGSDCTRQFHRRYGGLCYHFSWLRLSCHTCMWQTLGTLYRGLFFILISKFTRGSFSAPTSAFFFSEILLF